MRYLVVLAAVGALAVVPAAHGATACPGAKQGKVALSKLRASSTSCTTATKIAKTWARGAQKGHCVPRNVRSTAKCTVSGYSCRVTAQPTAVAPKELATCKRGPRKATWTAFFS
jgi:hypothetical protein